jgi:hypothetical protein
MLKRFSTFHKKRARNIISIVGKFFKKTCKEKNVRKNVPFLKKYLKKPRKKKNTVYIKKIVLGKNCQKKNAKLMDV